MHTLQEKEETWEDPEEQKQIYSELVRGRELRPKSWLMSEIKGAGYFSLLQICTQPICRIQKSSATQNTQFH